MVTLLLRSTITNKLFKILYINYKKYFKLKLYFIKQQNKTLLKKFLYSYLLLII